MPKTVLVVHTSTLFSRTHCFFWVFWEMAFGLKLGIFHRNKWDFYKHLNIPFKLKMHNIYDKREHVNSLLETFENESTNIL